jgi:hypothetical protein
VTASGASVGALGLSRAGCVASAGTSAGQVRAPRFDGGRRQVSVSEGVPGLVERAVVLLARRLCGQCWVSALEGVLGIVERAVALVVVLPARRRRHPHLVRYSFVADFDSTSSKPTSMAYPSI